MYIRTRLALWFTLILGLALAAFGFGVYQVLHSSLIDAMTHEIRAQAGALALAARPAPGTSILTVPQLDAFSTPGSYLEVLDPVGKVLGSAGDLGNHTLPFDPAAITADSMREQRVGDVPLLFYGRPVLGAGNQVLGYVLVARSPRDIYAALNGLQTLLYPGAALVLILGGGITWLLVRRAMRPLARLATTAGAIAAAQDHTRRVRLEGPPDEIRRLAETINGMLEALDSTYRQVQDVTDLQRHFLADVSHELRTPLTIMLSSLDLVRKIGPDDPEFQARTLDDMRVEADRMARMVTQLLLLARTDAGAAPAQSPILLVDVVADVCRQAGAGGAAGLACTGLDALEGAAVWGNADYLKQLFLILVDNACKYTPPGGQIEVSGGLTGDQAVVTVTDAGLGIAEADLAHIFDRFYRADNARHQPGSGLGLSIAARLAQLHGGQIGVTSTLGRGSRFTVTLPLLDQERLRSKTHPVGAGGRARSSLPVPAASSMGS